MSWNSSIRSTWNRSPSAVRTRGIASEHVPRQHEQVVELDATLTPALLRVAAHEAAHAAVAAGGRVGLSRRYDARYMKLETEAALAEQTRSSYCIRRVR